MPDKKIATVEDYLESLTPEKKKEILELRKIILKNIPKGFEETLSYGMIGYVFPFKLYKDGYHCDPKLPLPFLSIASNKSGVAIYHMGIYVDMNLLTWFQKEYPKHTDSKLDMGKSCIRFKKFESIPLKLIAELVSKTTVKEWILLYETNVKK